MSGTEYYLEVKWVEQIRQGDSEALKKLYKDNYPSIAHFVLNNSGTDTEAKDIYQESIIVFYEKIQNPDFQLNCLVKTFLYSVARRLWFKRLSEKTRYVGKITDYEDFIDFSEAETEDIHEGEERFKQMEHAMEQIGEPCQTILSDFYISKYSMQEIADKMGYTGTDNAKTQKYKCLQRLKKLFFKEYNAKN